MNKAAYDALPEQYKAMIQVAAQAQVIYTYAETEAMQFGMMAEMRDKHGVKVKRWRIPNWPRSRRPGWR
jgi:TRAP-type mannitol/chloroaromatic compound transport system substrate-binding protein